MDDLPPALGNPDILYQIFEEFALYQPCHQSVDYIQLVDRLYNQPDESDTWSKTLISAALVCKAFSEPASRVLWAVLNKGFAPLFRVFAAYKVIKAVDHSKDWMRTYDSTLPEVIYRQKIEWDPSVTPTAAEWSRFKHIASRVRCFMYHDYDRWIHPPYSTLLFEATSDGSPLFPNLQVLRFPAAYRYPLGKEFLRILLTPTIEAFIFFGFYNSKFHSKKINENLASVATVCKRVEHLRVHCDGQMPGDISFQKFRNLRSAYIENAYSCGDVLTMLNSLDHLEYFKATFYDTFQQSRTPLPPLSSTLPALHTLHIGTIPLYTMHQFLSSLNAPLSDVRASITDVRFFSEVTQLFDTLCSPRNTTSLHAVDFSFIILDWPDGRFERPGPSSFLKLTAPLLCLPSLDSLRIHLSRQPWGVIEYDATDAVRAWHGALAIDNSALKTMARAWPRLRHIVLTYSSEFTFMDAVAAVAAQDSPDAAAAARPPPGPSLGAVVDVALACPDLEELEMKVADVSEDDLKLLEARAEMGGARQTALVDLYLQGNRSEDSPQLPDLDRLAVALRHIFPMLRGTAPPLPSPEGNPSHNKRDSDLETLLEKLYALSISNRVL